MSDESDFDLDDNEDENAGIKKIREAYKALKKQNDELQKIANEVAAERRAKSVADTLKAKGVDPRYADFYTGEDTSPEAVNAWVEQKAELVGYAPQSPEDQERQQAAERISNVTATAPQQSLGTVGDIQQKLLTAKGAELDALLKQLETLQLPR